MPTAEKPAFRFGPFELQTSPPALHRDGELVSVTPKALATLVALVSRHGIAVGKEELLATIWSGTAVGEANLTQNVYTLRRLLTPDFPGQNPIENIPRFGYRFNLPVSEERRPASGADESRQPGALEMPLREFPEDPRRARSYADPLGTNSPLKDSEGPTTIPVDAAARQADGHSPRRFTGRDAWMVAGGLCTVIAALLFLGYRHGAAEGPPRMYSMVQLTASDSDNPVMAAAPSPDGEQIAYADDDGVMLRARTGGPPHPVRSPDLYNVTRIAWFPDNLHFAVSGQDPKTHVTSVWSLSATGDIPVLLRTDGTDALPSPDGRQIAFEANHGREIWISGLKGEGARRLLTAQGTRLLSLLLWSKDGRELYVSRHDADHSPDHIGKTPASGEFLAVEAMSAKILSVESGGAFDQACLLPGDELLLAGDEGEGHVDSTRLREVAVNPRNGSFRSPPRLVQTLGRAIVALSSAQGGNLIDAVIASGEADVYIADIDANHPGLRDLHRLTYQISASYPHSWTPDSRSVIFESRQTGPNQLYRQAIDTHNPTQLVSTPYDAAIPIITPDGRWIFFEGGEAVLYGKLFRIPGDGGSPTEINLSRGMGSYRCPLLRGACVLRQVVNNEVVFSRLDPLRGEGKPFYTEAATPNNASVFAVSPDGTELALIRAGSPTPRIHVVRFDKADKEAASSDIATAQPIEALQWSADGRGWFAEVLSPTRVSLTAHTLYFLDPSGKETLLARSTGHIFGVPSPDGKKLALVKATRDSNIWSLQ